MKKVNFIVIVAIVYSLSSCNLFKSEKKAISSPDTLITQSPKIVKPEIKDTVKIETIVQETEAVVVKTEPGIGYTSDKYYMVVGSFLSEKLALKYATTILDMGYDPQVIYSTSQGYYRVSAKSYNDYQTAISDISNFRGTVTNRAWVHVKK
jgi:hypothetical protein